MVIKTAHLLYLHSWIINQSIFHSLVQSVRILWLSIFIIQQLDKTLHVPDNGNMKHTARLRHWKTLSSGGNTKRNAAGGGVSPLLNEPNGGLAEQFVRQQVDLSHGVGQPHGQLLTQENVGRFLTRIVPAWEKLNIWILTSAVLMMLCKKQGNRRYKRNKQQTSRSGKTLQM